MTRLFAALGRFAVRFRWAVVAAWVAAAVLATLFLPSLDSVTSDSSAGDLPASSPAAQATRLAGPFQGADQTPVPVLVARDGGPLTATDTAATGRLAARLAAVPAVRQVQDLGVSADRQAVQLLVLARVNTSSPGPAEHLVDGLRQAIGGSALPGGLRAHLAGPVAAGIDTSRASHSSGNLGEDLSIVFILVLLLMVFRAVLAPLLTLAPAVLVTQLAGPVIAEAAVAGLRVSSLTQILILILALGAGTDYGLFLVFRVREELRAGQPPHDAVVRALSRVGESVAFSAATVIAALLTLLLATFGLFSGLGVPLAIAVGLMLAAALTLLPALLAIFGRAAFWPSRTAGAAGADGVSAGRPGWWGRIASRIVARPAAVLALGLAVFCGLAVAAAGYTPTGFGAARPRRPARTPPRAARCSPRTSRRPAATRRRSWSGSRPRCGPIPGRPRPRSGGSPRSRSSPTWAARCRSTGSRSRPDSSPRCTPGSGTRARCPRCRRRAPGWTPAPGPRTARKASSSARTGGPCGSRPAWPRVTRTLTLRSGRCP